MREATWPNIGVYNPENSASSITCMRREEVQQSLANPNKLGPGYVRISEF
jgi:hypothetical protein